MTHGDQPISRLMSTPVVSVDPKTQVREVLRLARTLGIHHCPPVGADGLLGIVCAWRLGPPRGADSPDWAHVTRARALTNACRQPFES